MTLSRTDLITTALLGTDRRGFPGPPDVDPASALLAEAARSVVAQRAGSVLPTVLAAPGAGPAGDDRPPAPPAAQAVLGTLLERPIVGLINDWLGAAVQRDVGVGAQHWAALLGLAARQATVDRRLLGQALGPAGRWFAGQVPAWQRLAGALSPPEPVAGVPPEDRPAPAQPPPPTVIDDPERIFAIADPWPEEVTDAALALIGSGVLLRRSVGYAAAVGLRVPLAHYQRVRLVAEQQAAGIGSWSGARVVRDALAGLDRTVYLRLEIARAFADPDQEFT